MEKKHQDIDNVELIRTGGCARTRGIAGLYAEYASSLRRFFINRGSTPEQADDLLQEVFVQVVRNIDRFRGDGAFSAWIWQIARNKFKDALRAANRQHQAPAELDDYLTAGVAATAAAGPVEDRLRDCVQQAFRRFKQDHMERAQALSLVAFHGWNIEEMSQFLGRTRAATREYLSQCRQKLRPFIIPEKAL